MSASFDLSSLAARYAAGDAATDVIRDVYQRIKADSSSAVWISIVEEEVAVERVRSAPRGPLYGIPFAVKDNINVAGLPTTCACPAFAHVPARSATVVERLEAAGAIVIGKTNLDQFATGLVGTRSPYAPRRRLDETLAARKPVLAYKTPAPDGAERGPAASVRWVSWPVCSYRYRVVGPHRITGRIGAHCRGGTGSLP